MLIDGFVLRPGMVVMGLLAFCIGEVALGYMLLLLSFKFLFVPATTAAE